jgi:hypothetical protein
MGARRFSFVTFSNIAGYFGNVNSFWKNFFEISEKFFPTADKTNIYSSLGRYEVALAIALPL